MCRNPPPYQAAGHEDCAADPAARHDLVHELFREAKRHEAPYRLRITGTAQGLPPRQGLAGKGYSLDKTSEGEPIQTGAACEIDELFERGKVDGGQHDREQEQDPDRPRHDLPPGGLSGMQTGIKPG